ncbi:hypothetical protein EGI22_19755 [Lacihabitans sp. LS3-19]|uniref:asparagine synthase-related protein n=1 Tax=Lacihabitans sp. LS3-19 TaxID=2487335 RepID=UPI0020CF9451|nr:asparagine synthase-related protein [Lacihabitans sp. LS3-19]MCP9770146.1 hypothetical protein [Lacihabitans sp. LS3-19]
MIKVEIDLDNFEKSSYSVNENDGDFIIFENENNVFIGEIGMNSEENFEKLYFQFLENQASFFDKLHYGFALINVNKKEKSVEIFRDFFGLKPLYISQIANKFIITSQIKPLALSNQKTLNKEHINDYLRAEYDDNQISESTFFENVFRILPGHKYHISRKGISKTLIYNSFEKPLESFKAIFEENIAEIGKKHTNISAHLSGGLDSSAIVGTFAKKTSRKPKAIYFDAGEGSNDEKSLAEFVAERFETSLFKLNNGNDFYTAAKELANLTFQPELLLFPSDIFKQIGEKSKSEVIVSGHGGDSIVGYGFEYLKELFLKKDAENLKKALEEYLDKKGEIINWNEKTTLNLINFTNYFFVKNWAYFLRKKEYTKAINYLIWGITELKISLWSVLRIVFLKLKTRKNIPHIESIPKTPIDYFPNSNQIQKQQINENLIRLGVNALETFYTINENLKIKSYYPFLDLRLLKTSINTELKVKFADGRGRGLLREAMQGILPEKIRNRVSKGAFNDFQIFVFNQMWLKMETQVLENETIWEFADKKRFFDAVSIIKNDNFTKKQKQENLWYCQRVLNLVIWLEELSLH